MMPATIHAGLTYPAMTDVPDGAAAMQALADDLDDELSRLDSGVRILEGRATGNLDLTATHVDSPGTSLTFTTNHPNAVLIIACAFEIGRAHVRTPVHNTLSRMPSSA